MWLLVLVTDRQSLDDIKIEPLSLSRKMKHNTLLLVDDLNNE